MLFQITWGDVITEEQFHHVESCIRGTLPCEFMSFLKQYTQWDGIGREVGNDGSQLCVMPSNLWRIILPTPETLHIPVRPVQQMVEPPGYETEPIDVASIDLI